MMNLGMVLELGIGLGLGVEGLDVLVAWLKRGQWRGWGLQSFWESFLLGGGA